MDRMKLKQFQYQRNKEERRGHNFAYLTDSVLDNLERMGYEQKGQDTWSEYAAIELADSLRSSGYYARVFKNSTSVRITKYAVYFRPKKQRKSQKTE